MKERVTSLLRIQPPVLLNRGLLFASGSVVPVDETDGYQTGCIYQHTDGGGGTALYVNEGSVTSCDFNPVDAGGITTPPIIITGDAVDALTGGGIQYGTSAAEITYTPVSTGSHSGFQIYLTSDDCIGGLSISAVRTKVTLTGTTNATAYGGQFWVKLNCDDYTGHYLGGHPVGVAGIIECVGTARTAPSVYAVLAGVCGEVRPISGTVDAGGTICGLHAKVFGTGAQVATGNVVGLLVQSLGGAAADAGILVQPHTGGAAWTVGLKFDGSYGAITTAIDIECATTPDTARTNHAIVIGGRSTDELTITYTAATALNYEPIQTNFDIAGVAPTSTSTMNVWQGGITHDTTDMPNLRLKFTDLLTTVKKDVKHVFIHQGEIVFGAASISASGVAGIGLTIDGGADAVTCGTYRGIAVHMRGAGTPANAHGVGVVCESGCTLRWGYRAVAVGTMDSAIHCGDETYANGPTCFASFPLTGEDPVVTAGAVTHAGTIRKIRCRIGTVEYFFLVSTAPA